MDELLNTKQLITVLGISRITLQNWIKAGLPVYGKVPGRGSAHNRFNWLDVYQWIDTNQKLKKCKYWRTNYA